MAFNDDKLAAQTKMLDGNHLIRQGLELLVEAEMDVSALRCDVDLGDDTVEIVPVGSDTASAIGHGATQGGTGGELMEPRNMDEWIQAMEATHVRIIRPTFTSHMDLPRPVMVRGNNLSHVPDKPVSIGYVFGGTNDGGPVQVEAEDVYLRNIASRPGPPRSRTCCRDGLTCGAGANRVTFDRCTVTWATDEGFDAWYEAKNLTYTRCLSAENLWNSPFKEWAGKGSLFGDGSQSGLTVHRMAFAAHVARSPAVGMTDFEVINCLVFGQGNWGSNLQGSTTMQNPPMIRGAYVGNVFIDGPDSPVDPIGGQIHFSNHAGSTYEAMLRDNVHWDKVKRTWEPALVTGNVRRVTRQLTAGLDVRPAAEVESFIYDEVGITPRDANDARIIRGMKDRTLRYVDCVNGSVPTDLNNNCARNVQFIRP